MGGGVIFGLFGIFASLLAPEVLSAFSFSFSEEDLRVLFICLSSSVHQLSFVLPQDVGVTNFSAQIILLVGASLLNVVSSEVFQRGPV